MNYKIFQAIIIFATISNNALAQKIAPQEILGIKIGAYCKDIGENYTSLLPHITIGSGSKDTTPPNWKRQCTQGNLNFQGGYQSESYLKVGTEKKDFITIHLTPDMKVWAIDLFTTWERNGPNIKIIEESLLERFGKPILFNKTISIEDGRIDKEFSKTYRAKWGTQNILKNQVDASANLDRCLNLNSREKSNCFMQELKISQSKWEQSEIKINGVVTNVSATSAGRAGHADRLNIQISDKKTEKLYTAVINKKDKEIENYLNKEERQKLPNF